MEERWKVIDGHPSYSVSDSGEVYSRKCNRKLTKRKNSMGYYRVSVDGKMRLVHRLVAIAFVEGRTETRNVVNHLDFNPENNNASNLEWTTEYENYRYSYDRGRFARTKEWCDHIKTGQIASSGKPVRSIDQNGNIKNYITVNSVKEDGHLPGMVTKCCKKERKTHHGLVWEYA